MSFSFKCKVEAGSHYRKHCPVVLMLPEDASVLEGEKIKQLSMKDDNGKEVLVQWNLVGESYEIRWIVDEINEKQVRVYEITSEAPKETHTGIEFVNGKEKTDIFIQGEYFTSYVYDEKIAKPYLGPIIGPYGNSYTRLDFEVKEHPHHRSLWLAIGDVEGVDTWNEPDGIYGKQRQQRFEEVLNGKVSAALQTNNEWTDYTGNPLVEEQRKITFYNTPSESRFVDLEVCFTASFGPVSFGATKEAGPLGIRVAESMIADKTGTIVNSYGSVGEEECWGKRAEWCDYYGLVEGKELGIAIYDCPQNENYPTYWHVRNYGLMAPNNFFFIGGKKLEKGEKMEYRYRIYFHTRNTQEARVAEHYHNYIHPPKTTILDS